MRIFAYCTESARKAVAQATGVEPLTSPPVLANEFDPHWLSGHDLIYFRLHGIPSMSDIWLNDGRRAALYKATVARARLDGAVVVVANCYGMEQGDFLQAFYRAGAGAVITGPGENMAAANRVVGTDLLVKWLLFGLKAGLPLGYAVAGAKARLVATAFRASDRDALAFRIVQNEGVYDDDREDL